MKENSQEEDAEARTNNMEIEDRRNLQIATRVKGNNLISSKVGDQ